MGTGTPGREAPFMHPTEAAHGLHQTGRAAPLPESGLACFLVRLGGRFLVPACAAQLASRAGAVKDARKRARQGLSLTAPSTAPGLGAVGTRKSSVDLIVGEPMRTPGTRRTLNPDVRAPRSAPRRNRRQHDGMLDRHAVKQHTLRSAHQTQWLSRPQTSRAGLSQEARFKILILLLRPLPPPTSTRPAP
jgi:hypothetical protein